MNGRAKRGESFEGFEGSARLRDGASRMGGKGEVALQSSEASSELIPFLHPSHICPPHACPPPLFHLCFTIAHQAAYIGQYAEGKRCGLGYLIMPDGGLYEGYFKADKFDGQGQYLYPDGSVYTGNWEAGLKHGHGVYWDTVKVRVLPDIAYII